ncbi:hypothetical protein WMO21_01950 [Lachnospiraceae bacterium CLA-AA-H58]|uniref:hypothetical protein n=1 Tax=Pilosibacter fragilis TaxID=3078042 RepID=UPI0032D22FE5
MKGYLDAKELESYKKEDLQELAKQLGVDAEGTKKEIATRCAAVEVDIPDESELTEEDKRAAEEAAAEAAAKAEEEEAATELVKVKAQRRFLDKELNQIKDTGDEYAVSRERAAVLEEAAAEAAAKAEEEEAATELVKVKAQRRFLDKELNQIKDTGDEYAVSRERAAVLEEAGVAAVIEE